MTARADCRGPKVLNGRSVVTGVPKDSAYDSHILSAPIFDAEYGDWPRSGCVLGDRHVLRACRRPRRSRCCTIRGVPWRRTASSTLSVPMTLVSTYERGAT